MRIEEAGALDVGPVAAWTTRAFSLLLLAGAAAAVALGGLTVVRMMTDAWVAPIHLSPDSDVVLQLNLTLTRHLAEHARLEAEIARIDGDLDAVAAAIERLTQIQDHGRESMAWQAELHGDEARSLAQILAGLRSQRGLLQRLHERQAARVEAAREDLAAGLIASAELSREEQALDSIAVSLIENERLLEEAQVRQRQVAAAASAYLGGLGAAPMGAHRPAGRKPEVAASEERLIRAELELMKLHGEERHLRALRQVAASNLARERSLLDEVKTRPLYRALEGSTNVAFVPYSQLEGVRPGADVLACLWGILACKKVGEVAEVLPGEVATIDPWGEMARGQYAILDLLDERAIQEKVLRVRGAT